MSIEGYTGSGMELDLEDPHFIVFREVAVEVLQVGSERVVPGARFTEDLDADSLDKVELVMGLEERFDINIDEEELEGVETVDQAYDLAKRKLAEKDEA